jgi:photosystem II stability/assembly factor-like uncharacterized protein
MDGGNTWEPRTRGLASDHVWSLASVERNGDIILYAGTEPAYLFQSTDYGATWDELPALRSVPGRERWLFPPPPHIAHVKSIAFDPRDSRTLYVGVEQGALLKSTDAGQSWSEFDDYVRPGDVFYKDVHRLAICPSDPEMIYMSGGDGLYVSADSGATWDQLTSLRSVRIGYPDAFVVSPFDNRVLFVAGAATDPPRLPEPLQTNIEGMSVQSWPGGFSIFAGTATGEVFASDDGGDTWALIASGLAPVSQSTHYRRFLPPEPVGTR